MAAHDITAVVGNDISKFMDPGTERRQPLAGFDEDYVDIVDYIIRCTHKIWEEKRMGLIYSHYNHNCSVWVGDGLHYGREGVIAGSIQALASAPDRLGYADEVVWTGNERDGFYTSHLNSSVGRNTGYSEYGPPTGKAFFRRGIALCLVKENRIVEEWLLRDDIATIRGMGFDLDETVAKLARRDMGKANAAEVHGEIDRVYGETTPEVMPPKQTAGFDVNDFVRRTMHEMWNWRMFNLIHDCYVPNYLCHTVDNRELYGRADYGSLVLGIVAAFPDAKFNIDQLFWMGDEAAGYRTSMRWSILGTHDGYGPWGEPTGTRVRMWGLTQHVIRDGKFVEEWTLWNELALLKRLYLARAGALTKAA
jgi:hypothetical protein